MTDETPCKACGQYIKIGSPYCWHCGDGKPSATEIKLEQFEANIEATFQGSREYRRALEKFKLKSKKGGR